MKNNPTVINDNTNNDKEVLETYMNLVDPDNTFYIDIGSSTEFNISNDRILASEQTIFFECDPPKVAAYNNIQRPNFSMISEKVTPDNILELIQNITSNNNPKLVDMDIDGYDYFVLDSLLSKIKPSLLVAEINEKIPPPIKFTVNYWPEYWFTDLNVCGNGLDTHFYGMSLSKFYELAHKYDYDVINLTFNNVYAVRKDKNPGLKTFEANELYDIFYKKLRLSGAANMFHYNANVDVLLSITPEEGISFLNTFYQKYKGKYELYI